MKFLLLLLLFTGYLSAQTITIAAAANMKYAIEDIAKVFTNNTGIDVKIVTGASGKLTQQIISGAPYDVFLSADIEFPTKLVQMGYATTPMQVYAYGTLILWTNTDLDISKGVPGLTNSTVKKIAIANPKTAPYGTEALNSIKFYKVQDALMAKLVIAESISQTATYVSSKSVDVGFMAKSIVLSPEMKNVGKWIELDEKSYKKIDQGMIGLKNGSPENQIYVKKFIQFMSSPKARKILKNSGYDLPSK